MTATTVRIGSIGAEAQPIAILDDSLSVQRRQFAELAEFAPNDEVKAARTPG